MEEIKEETNEAVSFQGGISIPRPTYDETVHFFSYFTNTYVYNFFPFANRPQLKRDRHLTFSKRYLGDQSV